MDLRRKMFFYSEPNIKEVEIMDRRKFSLHFLLGVVLFDLIMEKIIISKDLYLFILTKARNPHQS